MLYGSKTHGGVDFPSYGGGGGGVLSFTFTDIHIHYTHTGNWRQDFSKTNTDNQTITQNTQPQVHGHKTAVAQVRSKRKSPTVGAVPFPLQGDDSSTQIDFVVNKKHILNGLNVPSLTINNLAHNNLHGWHTIT